MLRLLAFREKRQGTAVRHRPPAVGYVATDLAQWLDREEMEHVRGAPYHPHTQGKIERWHRTLENRILLEHYDLERQVAAFVAHCNMPAITRASTILPKLASSIAERVVALTMESRQARSRIGPALQVWFRAL